MRDGRRTLVVIGDGMVGHRLVELLVEAAESDVMADAAPWELVVFGDEPRPAYDRVHLSDWFTARDASALALAEPGYYEAHGVDAVLGDAVVAIDREARVVRSAAGREIGYDAVVLATGSRPFVPPVPGALGAGRFVYRTIEDLEAIAGHAAQCTRGVVIGGGLLGLEAANALRVLGLETHVVELAPRLMAVQIDDDGARLLRRRVEGLGLTIHTATQTAAIEELAGDDAVAAGGPLRLRFGDGRELITDMVVWSTGIRPRDELARASGLALGPRGGIAVDDSCQTSDPAIHAIGECAAWNGQIFGLVGPGYQMARVVAGQLTGDGAATFTGADLSTKLKLLGVDVASLGDAHATTPGAQVYALVDGRRDIYKKIVVDPTGRHLLGGVLVGDASDFGRWQGVMAGAEPLPEDPATLLVPAAPLAATAGAAASPAQLVCTCNGVTRGAVCAAIAGGCGDVGAVKKATRAGTGCGGCVPLVTDIVRRELAARGVAVSKDLCEHFPYSRQELHHLVKVRGHRTFAALLAAHGKGLGCDICKPTAASILASVWNDHILEPAHAPLQDSNDYFLANLQRDGTYSVVPRVAGGEITPAKLIAIGQVAEKYDLYTKITGGQRIDLFGAKVHQLPAIWAELVAAGFESGHAYGKALRTVKTCVGSTWCRYGVQDSVGAGIRLEERYKGLRAPHKLKMAVSGCTRECAEAQSKDVGVIATERGYNLYVCGNGGMRPRHADLLAADLDEATLVRFIDRFLMFYIRTADRLQRTARWLEALDGGLEYLRAVVVDDCLGIGAELEAEMDGLVGSYRCEWAATLEDPEKLKRFRTFINSDQEDEEQVYVRERGQRRPAYPDERVKLRVVS